MSDPLRLLLSGNEALARAARDYGVALGTGYPGTPSTEILESFAAAGGRAQWAPNEKVAFEVALGAAFGGAPALVTMKHVGLNVAADPFFTAAYTGVPAPLVVVSADDPGMASSQNEQDNRRYAVAAGVPMWEPADSQEAYEFAMAAFELSRRWSLPVLLRMTSRVCHAKTVVVPHSNVHPYAPQGYRRDLPGHVMIPSHARPAHRRLRAKLAEIAAWNETNPWNRVDEGQGGLEQGSGPFFRNGPEGASHNRVLSPVRDPAGWGLITAGIAYQHAREAAPQARILKLACTHPLPLERIRRFAAECPRCVVVEEGDPYLVEQIRAAGIDVAGLPASCRFGELNVTRVRYLLTGQSEPEPLPPRDPPPALCPGCPHRQTFAVLQELACIVPGDIGCYSLGALPPYEAMDALVCMGAGIGLGLGLRHVLPEAEARRVVSVIGDSTFVHSGITGLAEMVYNRPPTGHVVLILDNDTTAMTGFQDHPGTGRTLDGRATGRIDFAALAKSLGIEFVATIDPITDREALAGLLRDRLATNELSVIIVRRPCPLAAGKRPGHVPCSAMETT